MPCPWLKNGMCTSPKLSEPTSSVVDPQRCYYEYTQCRFYVSEEENVEGLEKFMKTKEEKKYKPYRLIHALITRPKSQCPYFKTFKGGDGHWYAVCTVLDRLLTTSEVKLCETAWKTCSFRKIPKVA